METESTKTNTNSIPSSNNMEFVSSKFLTFEDSITGKSRQLSYYQVEGTSLPGVVLIPGFMAIKEHRKSIEILKYCHENNIPCVSYDSAGYGESVLEVSKNDARFTHWIQDAREILLNLTNGPQVVVGSSMGGWLGSILAQEIPDKFASLIMLAPAYNFGEYAFKFYGPGITPDIEKRMREDGFVHEVVDPKFPGYGGVPISYELFEGMAPFNLPLEESSIDITIPVRIIHGTKDEIFPVARSERLLGAMKGNDVSLLIIKGCTHELSDDKGIENILKTVKELRSK